MMEKFRVFYRADENSQWSDEFYADPYIEAESKEDAISIAKEFVTDCGCDPENYDWIAEEYEG